MTEESPRSEDVFGKDFTIHLLAVNFLEKIMAYFKGKLNEDVLNFCILWLNRIGHLGILASAGLGFLFALITAVRTNSFRAFLLGIGWVLLIFVAQYTAYKFHDAGETLIRNNPTQMASLIFLDCLGFLMVGGGFVFFIYSIVRAGQGGGAGIFILGLGIFITAEFLALAAFNPTSINIGIVGSNPAGQEAIGIFTFFFKALMKLTPILFGSGIIVGLTRMFINFFAVFGSGHELAWENGVISGTYIMGAALIPFAGYLAHAFYFLVIDIIKAILTIPELKR